MQVSAFRVTITFRDSAHSIEVNKDPDCTLCNATTAATLYLGRRVITFETESKSLPAVVKRDTNTNELTELVINVCYQCKSHINLGISSELHSDVASLFIPNGNHQMNDYGTALKQAAFLNMIPMATLLLDTMTDPKELKAKIENRDPNLKANTIDLDILEALGESLVLALNKNHYHMINLLLLRGATLPENSPEARDKAITRKLMEISGVNIREKYLIK
ncbi:hypothetical protein [Endozoicomonas sp.]|uniref:hypothetical protein n=1 Tax=Endozoicomonas sp. TaxID=1892382 RepID=UPI0028842793|nr:hypothetical protein [Endozoicomonas sp.]